MHHAILALWFTALGCCVGSFLNVCAYRIPRGLSLLRPRSRCPRCRAAIRAYDNVPVLGWLILRGECRACGGAISPRYPLVELGVGLSFAGLYLAEVVCASRDLWEQTGAVVVLFRLLMLWTAISIVVVAALTVRDARADSARRAHGPGVGGQNQGLSRCEHAGLEEPIPIQFGDLVGTVGIPQPVAGDASESLVRLDHVDRRIISSPGIARAPGR
jgi:leader peptidase (prepilin peptidase)/N-methyltransferase